MIRLYNTLTRKVEDFIPAHPPKVEMFVCGPTVYDLIHVGNARTFTVFDVLARWLRYRDYDVTYLQNITDIDDKIIARADKEHEDPLALAERYYNEFMADSEILGNTAISGYVRATEHIELVLKQVGVAVLPSHLAAPLARRKHLKVVETGHPQLSDSVWLNERRDGYKSPALTAFRAAVLEEFSQPPAEPTPRRRRGARDDLQGSAS